MNYSQGPKSQGDHHLRYAAICAVLPAQAAQFLASWRRARPSPGGTGIQCQRPMCVDEGRSGTILERLALQRRCELIRARAIQGVIVYDRARLSRNLGHQLLVAGECEDADVAVHVVHSPSAPRLEGFTFHVHDAHGNGGERGAN
jgi:hypothetical protein